ncbi:MAG: DUF3375 domain-containing protein [Bifidobacteriaceae bacterium]|jgi:hypothetical protein|nr:DUF3375 domain-containing protein [Bifidobacteriaceae bacterium]
MPALPHVFQLSRLAKESPAWGLLRADRAPVILALLGRHLGGEVRRLPAPVLAERIEDDLADLRADFPDLRTTAQGYLISWREQGFLIRGLVPGTREETLELSDAALAALAFVNSLEDHKQVATASRLETILERTHALNVATDPAITTRLAALEAQKEDLEREIERVQAGHFEVISKRQAAEWVADILALASGLPADFARVKRQFEEINVGLMRQLIEDESTKGAVLAEIFDGISRLDESEQGQSFDSFHALASDPERSSRYDEDVDAILRRDLADSLEAVQIHALRNLLPRLQTVSLEVNEAKTALNRSLRRFVQSGEHDQARQVHLLVKTAAAAALKAADHARLTDLTDFHLEQTLIGAASIGEIAPHDPAETRSVTPWTEHVTGLADVSVLEELAREVDIDFQELEGSVRQTLADRGAATIGEILESHPATQGLASVIGLLVLALRRGSPRLGVDTELVGWHSSQGEWRTAAVPVYLFEELI